MELDEVAEELDEEDLALGRVRGRGGCPVEDLDGSRAHRDERLVTHFEGVPARDHARPHVVVAHDDDTIARALGDLAADDVVVAHEAGDELGLGPRCDRERVGDLLDARLVHDDNPVRHRERFLLIVRDVDEHQAELALEVAELDAHAQLQQPVEVAERLVEQERLRFRHEHARQCDTLLLAARECARLAVGELGEADHLQRVERLLAPVVLLDAMHLEPELDVLEHRAVREEREVLEDGGRRSFVRREVHERLTVEHDVAFGRELVPADHPQRRRLAAAGRAQEDDVLAVVDVQVDVLDGDGAAGKDLGERDQVEARPLGSGGGGVRRPLTVYSPHARRVRR